MTRFRSEKVPDEKPPVAETNRPWGGFRQYAHNAAVTISLMTVFPHSRTSLQEHTGRAELWIILDEGAVVQVGEDVLYPQEGEEIWIPANCKHRLGCGSEAVRVLEVAFGDWIQEDIHRYEDDYNRPEDGE